MMTSFRMGRFKLSTALKYREVIEALRNCVSGGKLSDEEVYIRWVEESDSNRSQVTPEEYLERFVNLIEVFNRTDFSRVLSTVDGDLNPQEVIKYNVRLSTVELLYLTYWYYQLNGAPEDGNLVGEIIDFGKQHDKHKCKSPELKTKITPERSVSSNLAIGIYYGMIAPMINAH